MNKLFKTGQYVLLTDCEAYDDKYALLEDTTKWMIAKKLEGGDVDRTSLLLRVLGEEVCVGIEGGDVGVWTLEGDGEVFEQLSVEDVLYASEEGLTLDELSGIPCAFDEGKEYTCVKPAGTFCLGSVSTHNGIGLRTRHGTMATAGSRARFKPVGKPKNWIPSVGEMVQTSTGEHEVLLPADVSGMLVINYLGEHVIQCLSGCKPVDKERESAISKITDFVDSRLPDYTGIDDIVGILYDAGMLKSIK